MFGFLKKKLKEAVSKFTKDVEVEAEVVEEVLEEKKVKEETPKVEKKSEPKAEKKKQSPSKKEESKQKEIPSEEKKEDFKETLKEDIKPTEEEKEKPVSIEKEPISEEETVEEQEEEIVEEEKIEEPKVEKKGFFKKLFGKKEEQEIEEKEDTNKEDVKKVEEPKVEKKGFFSKISESVTKVSLSEKKFDEIFWDLELALLENNVAVEVIEKIKQDLKTDLVENKISRGELETEIMNSLKRSISSLFDVEQIDLLEKAKEKKPYIIAFIGVNGAGKTTNLAKLAYLLKENGLEPVVGACDTFRAAAIQQLQEHTDKLKVKLIKHDYGADPAAVAYDTIDHAKAKRKSVVLLDTAGRLHSNDNLMKELKKIIKVANPDLKIFVGESLAGNDVVEQVKLFNETVGIDAIILSKADTDEKGGAAISVSYVTGKPILYLGTGQTYADLTPFDKDKLLESIGL